MTNAIRLVRKGLKVLAILAMPTLAFGATVVHDAGRDFVMNSDSRNVYTNCHGGVWSFMRSSSLGRERTLLPADSLPCFAANPTAVQDDNTFVRASSFPLVQPDEMSCHPDSGDLKTKGE